MRMLVQRAREAISRDFCRSKLHHLAPAGRCNCNCELHDGTRLITTGLALSLKLADCVARSAAISGSNVGFCDGSTVGQGWRVIRSDAV